MFCHNKPLFRARSGGLGAIICDSHEVKVMFCHNKPLFRARSGGLGA